MICPFCRGRTEVVNTRGTFRVYRERWCPACLKLFYTEEKEVEHDYGHAKIREYENRTRKRARSVKDVNRDNNSDGVMGGGVYVPVGWIARSDKGGKG